MQSSQGCKLVAVEECRSIAFPVLSSALMWFVERTRRQALGKRQEEWFNQAQEHLRAGRHEAAVTRFQKVLQVRPWHPGALIGMVDALEVLGRNTEAIGILEEAAKEEANGPLRGRLADAFHAEGNLASAIAWYQQAIALDPTLAGCWWGLGCALASVGDHASAAESYQRLVALQPGHGMAWLNLGKSLFELGRVEEALNALQHSIDPLPQEAQCLALGNIAIAIPGSTTADNQTILKARQEWSQKCLPPAAPRRQAHGQNTVSGRPMRLGYVSSFFDKRNWMKPVWGLINHHDRDRFQIHLFSDGPLTAIGEEYQRHLHDHFHDVKGLSNSALAQLIEAVQIDLLVDLNGYSRPSRLPLFQLRPATTQVSWFNMFATSGLESFDFLIGDEHVIPLEEEGHYTERVVRIPGSYLTFEVQYAVPEVAPPPCLKTGGVTLGCLAPMYKISPEVIEAWSSILRRCPASRLILKNVVLGHEQARAYVRGQFVRSGISPERLELDGPVEHFAFLKRYDDMDIVLDTFPYNGGTTTMEALWQGVPVLTFRGDRWASRISASLLLEAGLPDFVADDLAGFIERAVSLGRDPATPEILSALRRTMRSRLQGASVCNTALFTSNMEKAFEQMLQCNKNP